MRGRVTHWFDYKSPYAWLAQADIFALAEEPGVEVEWLPYTLDIPSYLGSAELDSEGRDRVGTRNAHQWRRVRYAYMDCRREASRRALVLRGPRQIFDSRIAHAGFLFARNRGSFRAYHEAVFERFFARELDLEDSRAIAALLDETGLDSTGFSAFARDEGARELAGIQAEAEEAGVFGVPSYRVSGELFWGAERLDRVREKLSTSTTP